MTGGDSHAEKTKASNRKVIYTGSVTLRVASKTTGREEIDRIVKKYDGLIVTATLDEVIFRVTPEQFEAAMNDVAQAGEVASKEIKSEDVTDQFFDLALRVDVAEGSRKRLMELLGRSGAVKDVLEVERDLRRLTEEIEQLKGFLRKMQDQIDLATIKVMLQEKQLVAQPRRRAMASTFGWMNQVGLDKLLEAIPSEAPLEGESSLHSLFFGPRFRLAVGPKDLLPAGFLPALYDGFDLIGVTAQDHRLRVQQIELRQEGELGIWADALGEEFKSYRGYIIRQRETFKLNDTRLQAIALRCETAVESETWAYDVWLVQNPDQPKKLLVAEYAREKSAGDDHFPDVEQAIRGMKVQ